MLEELRWRTSPSATALHAAYCREQQLAAADRRLGELLDPTADRLMVEIDGMGWPLAPTLRVLTALASEFDSNRELVSRAANRLGQSMGASQGVGVVGAITDLEAALNRAYPDLAEELAVRGRPLREQWEARGPGLLVETARLTESGVVPARAEIVFVAPYAGGQGVAHAAQNRVTLEAVLVNPHPQLPETVRLAWLLCQLNSDLPIYADLLPASNHGRAFSAAMVAPVLAAAEEVELAACDEAAIESALQAWGLGGDLPSDAATRIWNWWNAWLDRHTTWPVAVAALDQLLA